MHSFSKNKRHYSSVSINEWESFIFLNKILLFLIWKKCFMVCRKKQNIRISKGLIWRYREWKGNKDRGPATLLKFQVHMYLFHVVKKIYGVLRAKPRIENRTEEEVLSAIKRLAGQLLFAHWCHTICQDYTDPVRHFSASIKEEAINGKFHKDVKCAIAWLEEFTAIDVLMK